MPSDSPTAAIQTIYERDQMCDDLGHRVGLHRIVQLQIVLQGVPEFRHAP